MAERRMFTDKITESDVFLDMPLSTQALYFHFCMNADDDGFVKNPKRIQRMLGASDDDCKLLVLKRFVLPFESGVIVIKHWRMHNLLRKDRYKPTEYIEEKSMLKIKENGAYTFDENQGFPLLATSWQPNDNQLAPQYSIGKDSIDKNSINTICEVPEADTTQKEEIFIKLILNDNTYYELPMSIVNQYEELYKAVDVKQEIRNASAWLISNQNKRKTRRGVLRFLNSWLERKQNSGGNFNNKPNQPQFNQTFATHNYTKEQTNSVFDDIESVNI